MRFMEQWLVISNCQTYGIANCLQAQAQDIVVSGIDSLLFNSDPERFNAELSRYDKLFIPHGISDTLTDARLGDIVDHVELPIITFRAFHPDLIYLLHDDRPIAGPARDYHSAIAYACFCAGMSVADTTSRFTGLLFERCGYLRMWLPERDRLVGYLARLGLDITQPIRSWGRSEAFMYSINHPRIQVLHVLAAELLRAQGRKPFAHAITPHDNLASSAVFAIYPEIGEALGIAGGYAFKNHDSYRPVDLTGFVAGCFEIYARIEPNLIKPHPQFEAQFEYVAAMI
jgi:hypothetical protein